MREGVIIEGSRVIRIDAVLELAAVAETVTVTGDNTDADLEARGYTGNPNLLFFETHADLGGPIVRDRAWFYAFYNHFRIDKAVSGVDRSVATDLGDFDNFGGKVTLRLTDQDRVIGYTQWGLKEKPKRGLSTDVGPDSVLAYQSGWPYAPIQRVDIPGTGTNQPIFLTDLSENRSENITIVDLRLDKAFDLGASGRVSLMLDPYNLFNANAMTNFSLRTGDNERVITALDPLAMKLGVRYQF